MSLAALLGKSLSSPLAAAGTLSLAGAVAGPIAGGFRQAGRRKQSEA